MAANDGERSAVIRRDVISNTIAGLIVAAVVGVAGVVAGQAFQGSDGGPSSADSPTISGPTSPGATSSMTSDTESAAPESLATDSITGEPNGTIASITTGSRPIASVGDYLFDLTPIEGDYQAGSKSVNGQPYARSVFRGLSVCNSGEGKSVQYNLGRKYSIFTATAGLSDEDTRGQPTVQFRIDTDRGNDFFTSKLGESRRIKFDVRGAIYLRLTVYEPNGSGPCVTNTVAVWGDAKVS
jgi:hypothetical protein